jgi:hypothetical protein
MYICKSGPQLNATDWIKYIITNAEGTFDYTEKIDQQTNVMYGKFENVEYIEKLRDSFLAHGIGLLRTNKLIEDAEEDFIIDLDANGIGSW